MIRHHSTGPDSAGVVISNELLDAFAPIRLRIVVQDREPQVENCFEWAEMRLVHIVSYTDLQRISGEGGIPVPESAHLKAMTHDTFCEPAKSSLGELARELIFAESERERDGRHDQNRHLRKELNLARKHEEASP